MLVTSDLYTKAGHELRGCPAKVGGIMKEAIRLLHGDAGCADRAGVRALVTDDVTLLLRSKKLHALLSSGIRCAAWARDGRLSPRMDSCGVQLRHEQPRQLCSCRHVAAYPRHSPAPETRARLLGRRSAHSGRLGSCCAPVAQDEAVRQLCQCCWIVECMLATAVARGPDSTALI